MNLSLTFHIGPDPDACKSFIYELGVLTLNQLLEAEVAEHLRNFINSIPLSKIYDIKGELAQSLLKDLNHSFNCFGITFENVQIPGIKIPDQIRDSLRESTKYTIKLDKQKKEQ